MWKKKYAHTQPLFKKLKLFTIAELYIYSIQLFCYKYHHNLLPNIFCELFTYHHNIHDHRTRQHELFHVPKSRSVLSSRMIRVQGVRIDHCFSRHVNRNCTFPTYKRRLKTHIQENDILFLL